MKHEFRRAQSDPRAPAVPGEQQVVAELLHADHDVARSVRHSSQMCEPVCPAARGERYLEAERLPPGRRDQRGSLVTGAIGYWAALEGHRMDGTVERHG